MAKGATAVWEVRTTGNVNNGAAFDSSLANAGTDYTQQDSPQLSNSDGATSGIGVTTFTSATGGFTALMVGNAIHLNSGTNATADWYFITAFTNSNTVTLDRAPDNGVGGVSAGVFRVGGAHSDPALVCGGMVGGNTLYLKNGTYTITSTTSNGAAGRLTPPAGTTANATQIIGYSANRTPFNQDVVRPLLQQSSAVSNTTITGLASANLFINNIAFDGASLSGSIGLDTTAASSGTFFYQCKFSNFASFAHTGGNATLGFLSEFTGCSGATSVCQGSSYAYCAAHDNTTTGFFNAGDGNTWTNLISCNNTGASSDGFRMSAGMVAAYNCVAYKCGRDGFRFTAGAEAIALADCIAELCSGWGYRASASFGNARILFSGGLNNTLGMFDSSIPTANILGSITASQEIFTNPANNDFSLNNLPLGGALFRKAGLPGNILATMIPGLSTKAYPDCGAAQSNTAATVQALSHYFRRWRSW